MENSIKFKNEPHFRSSKAVKALLTLTIVSATAFLIGNIFILFAPSLAIGSLIALPAAIVTFASVVGLTLAYIIKPFSGPNKSNNENQKVLENVDSKVLESKKEVVKVQETPKKSVQKDNENIIEK